MDVETFSLEKSVVPRIYCDKEDETHFIVSSLQKILPPAVLYTTQDLQKWTKWHLPFFNWSLDTPMHYSFFLFCEYKEGLRQEEFFCEMLKKHLLPGQEVIIRYFRYASFNLGESETPFILIEVKASFQEKVSNELVQSRLPFLAQIVTTGCLSLPAAKFTLTNPLLSHHRLIYRLHEQKMVLVQKNLCLLMNRFPYLYEAELLNEWSGFLTLSDAFLESRTTKHLTQLVSTQFIFQKRLKRNY